MKKDYYGILGLTKDASQDDIKKAFRQLSMQYHPDKNPEGADRFKEINEAYQTLSDSKKKMQYDLQGQGGGFEAGNWNDFFSQTDNMFSGFGFAEDIFQTREHIANLDARVYTSIKDAVNGVKKVVKIKRRTWCESCANTRKTCHTCNGSGHMVKTRTSGFFSVQEKSTCTTCGGSGSIKQKTSNCPPECNDGFILQDWDMHIELPKGFGMQNQYVVRNVGHESALRRGQRGDVVVKIVEQPEDNHEREGNDILITDFVKYVDLVQGCKRTIKIFDDSNYTHSYNLPKWYDTDNFIKLCDGPLPNGKTYIRVKLQIPKRDLKEEYLEILKSICED